MILNSSKCRIRVDLRESFLFDIKNLTKFRHDRDKSESCMRFQTLFKDSTNSNKRWMDGHAMVNENGRPIFEEKKAAKQRPANDDKEGGRVDETTAPCVHISGWLHRRGRRCNHLDDEI